jgi:carbon storage regulator CsrA
MLVLSRKLGEKIYIDDNIGVTVVSIRYATATVELGIAAQPKLSIFPLGETCDGPSGKWAVIPRQVNETVSIGDDVVITLLEFRKEAVRLGFKAPAHVQVVRSEIYVPPESRRPAQDWSKVSIGTLVFWWHDGALLLGTLAGYPRGIEGGVAEVNPLYSAVRGEPMPDPCKNAHWLHLRNRRPERKVLDSLFLNVPEAQRYRVVAITSRRS